MRADSTSSTVSGLFTQASGFFSAHCARRHGDLGQLLAGRAELVHVARGGEGIGGRREERPVRGLVRVDSRTLAFCRPMLRWVEP